jgi:hypothetical protein
MRESDIKYKRKKKKQKTKQENTSKWEQQKSSNDLLYKLISDMHDTSEMQPQHNKSNQLNLYVFFRNVHHKNY